MKTLKFLTAALIALMFVACQEKKTDCVAVIECTDAQGNSVSGANVELFAMVKNENKSTFRADLTANGVSDEAGTASFIFKLPAIYDIEVKKDGKIGTGIVKLEEGKSVKAEITLQ